VTLDPELADLIPVFLEEARDRLERLATAVPKLEDDPEALAVAKRELHTLKGAGRMLQLAAMAELCHAAEELLGSGAGGNVPLLTRAVDRLAAMVDEVAEGRRPEADDDLMVLFEGQTGDRRAAAKKPSKGGKPSAKTTASGRKTRSTKKAASAGKKPSAGKRPSGRKPSGKKLSGKKPSGKEPSASTETSPAGKAASKGVKRGRTTPSETEKAPEPKPRAAETRAGKTPERKGAASKSPAKQGAAGQASAETTPKARSGGAPAERPPGSEDASPALSAPLTSAEIRVDAASIDTVADQATQMRIMALATHRVTERIYELARLAEDGIYEDKPSQVLAVLATMLRRVAVDLEGGQRRMSRASERQLDNVLTLQVQPLRGYLLSLARHARDLARSLGREVEVEISGEHTRLDRRIARELDDALLHLVRNAVDHGIESPEERREKGKPEAGKIRIAAEGTGSRVHLVIEDDGAGIEPEEVVEEAAASGIIERGSAASLSRDEIYQLLFAAGFSTRRRVSEISGRGVGLDVVAASVIRVGGEVFLESEPGEGTRVTMEVPLARRGEQVFLLRVGQVRLALPKGAVRQSRPLLSDQVVERSGRSLARFEEGLVPFVPLAAVYGETVADSQLLLEGEVSGQRFALAVDEVEGEEEVLVRPVPRSVATDRLLEGVALLASGEPVGVLSPPVLAQRDLLRHRRTVPERAVRKAVRVLLVDDSLVTREMERRLLEDAGFDVTAAGDADEALSTLGEHTFDCLVTDIEMPGMDGFELTEHLRGIEHFGQLPIIVVSTRDRPEDRLRGLKAGADAYLTKQSLDAGELVDLVRRLSATQ
jgi:two-component system chemotaxis sensor kinase CheA